jgi:flavin reductase (DIM6/NTAB) family NADH-FMN oxidoreductase RutF
MDKIKFKPSTLLSPVPVVMVSLGDKSVSNIITVAWVGTVNSEPPMISISVRRQRYSYDIINKHKTFGVNLVSTDIVERADWCGVKSGKEIDKFKECNFTKFYGDITGVPLIKESTVNIECEVKEVVSLGSHDMFIGEVVAVYTDASLSDDKGKLDLAKANLISYAHGEYFALDKRLGFFGYSVAREEVLRRRMGKE